jgi:flagellar hook-length control protein FliK
LAAPRGAARSNGEAAPQFSKAPGRSSAARAGKGEPTKHASPAEQAKRIEQFVRVMRQELGKGNTRIVMRLSPSELGNLRVEASLKGDALTLRVQTETQVAHELLKQDADTLRQALELAGIRLEHMEVRPPVPTDRTEAELQQPESDGRHAEREPSPEADTDGSPPDGTDSSPIADATHCAAGDSSPELALDARVNVLA